jgi:geranylgeranyl pyrophosphate synthase
MLQLKTLDDIYVDINHELGEVSARLGETLSNCFALLGDGPYGTDMLRGKLIRPALCLMSGKLFSDDVSVLIDLATACELVHIATLIHDDVVDDADVRRGIPSVNARWDEKSAVLAGDRIVCEGLLLLSKYRTVGAAELMLRTLRRVVNGELRQLHSDRKLDEATCIEVTREKTGSLMSAVCRLPAMWAGAEPENVTALAEFGEHFGVAFQIADDLLDLVGEEQTLGKTPLSDIRNGKQTLPIIYLRDISRSDQTIENRLVALVDAKPVQEADARRVAELIRESGCAERTMNTASAYVSRAKQCLEVFPESPAKDALLSLSDFVIDRRS